MESNLIYGFNKQKTFKARYIIGNSKLSKEHKRYNKISVGQEESLLVKRK